MHQITPFVLAIAHFDKPERWIVILLLANHAPVPEKAVVGRLGPSVGPTVIRRAIRRLTRDRVIAAIQRGYLQVVDPRTWPAHRVADTDLDTLEQLVGHLPIANTDQPTLEREAVAQARQAARRRTAEKVPTPKLHLVQEDDTAIDSSWLDVEAAPQAWPEDPVMSSSNPKPTTSPAIPPNGDHVVNAFVVCESCDHARTLLSSEHAGYRDWAKQHLASCGRSPKGPGRPLATR